MDIVDDAPQWFYNIRTGEVEQGRQSSWEDLMGPYSSPAEAAKALETAAKRNNAWDDADADWSGDDG